MAVDIPDDNVDNVDNIEENDEIAEPREVRVVFADADDIDNPDVQIIQLGRNLGFDFNRNDVNDDDDNDVFAVRRLPGDFDEDNPTHILLKNLHTAMVYPAHYGLSEQFYQSKTEYYPGSNRRINAAFRVLDKLRRLSVLQQMDLHYMSMCGLPGCGCRSLVNLVHIIGRSIDIRSLRYILNHNLVDRRVLCESLACGFRHTGTLTDRPQKVLARVHAEILEEIPNASDREISRAIARYIRGKPDFSVNIIDDNVGLILEYLCNRHPDFLRGWRCPPNDEVEHPYTILDCAFHGYADEETRHRWVAQLIAIGCEPFAQVNEAGLFHDTAFHQMGVHLMHEDMKAVAATISPDALRIHVNSVNAYYPDIHLDTRNRSRLMDVLYDRGNTKRRDVLHDTYQVIALYVQYGADLNHLTLDGCNAGDYVDYYGWRNYLRERMDEENNPHIEALLNVVPTGRIPVNRWDQARAARGDIQLHNPSPFARLLYGCRRYKSTEEIANFTNMWRMLVDELLATDVIGADGKITKAAITSTGTAEFRRAYDSVNDLICRWGFRDILQRENLAYSDEEMDEFERELRMGNIGADGIIRGRPFSNQRNFNHLVLAADMVVVMRGNLWMLTKRQRRKFQQLRGKKLRRFIYNWLR
jgi:hypothetical protein